jgi:hypothetical protein
MKTFCQGDVLYVRRTNSMPFAYTVYISNVFLYIFLLLCIDRWNKCRVKHVNYTVYNLIPHHLFIFSSEVTSLDVTFHWSVSL